MTEETVKSGRLDEWRACFERWAESESALRNLDDSASSDKISETIRSWWRSTSTLLMLNVELQHRFQVIPDPPPLELLAKLAWIAEDFGNGNLSPMAELGQGRGTPKTWAAERRNIASAVRYLDAVEDGKIADRSPTKTVAQCFGVHEETVRGWRRRRSEILDGLPSIERSADLLTQQMQTAGKTSRLSGRGHRAILARRGKS